jgi:alkylhydroperoxidase/carboxymuconolactone decarboxylase family protein YurZ
VTQIQPPSPFDLIRELSPDVAAKFIELRGAACAAGPIDEITRELILISSFASAGLEEGFKNHARGLLQKGVSKTTLQHAVVIPLGATMLFLRAVDALRWIEDVSPQVQSQNATPAGT